MRLCKEHAGGGKNRSLSGNTMSAAAPLMVNREFGHNKQWNPLIPQQLMWLKSWPMRRSHANDSGPPILPTVLCLPHLEEYKDLIQETMGVLKRLTIVIGYRTYQELLAADNQLHQWCAGLRVDEHEP